MKKVKCITPNCKNQAREVKDISCKITCAFCEKCVEKMHNAGGNEEEWAKECRWLELIRQNMLYCKQQVEKYVKEKGGI